eukprot:CAMPEP_0204902598 /NCGR_PEP_ID=MMETSP1397-20131031/3767_1 /ASSEMBLY_ACC=CAM_ASM_000891 /TAXON_ID=49980 /ORGANISM="Climacostomum Climacostomum virens, Strain Stock W-24" /LENGTH=401 /DNA_ID=CAMNT_0052071129 /DNA_START=92 /DNA_END=1297 /DNA_ORIENTATION=+
MRETHELTIAQKGLLGAAEELGKFLGNFYFGYLSDNYGRAYSHARSGIWLLVGALLLPWCPSESLLYFPILLIGFGLGAHSSVGGTLILESIPQRQQWAITLTGGCWSIGGTLAGLSAFAIFYFQFSYFEVWRTLSLFGLLVTLVVLLRFYLIETPAFLFSKKLFVEYYNAIDHIIAFSGDFRYTSKRSLLADSRLMHMTYSLKANKAAFSTLLDPKHVWKTLSYTMVYLAAGFTHAGYTFLVPAFIKVSSKSELYGVVCMQQLMGLPCIFLASTFVILFGKFKAIFIAFVMSSLSLLLLLLVENEGLIIVCTGLVVLLISIGFSALFAVTPESYPVCMRGVASGWTSSMSRLAGVVSPIAASCCISWFGSMEAAVVLYSISAMISGVFALLIPPLRRSKK